MDEADFEPALQEARHKLNLGRVNFGADDLSSGAGSVEIAEGEAADGRVRAVAARGRLESVFLDPRVMRMSGTELSEHVVAAANVALDELRANAPTSDDMAIDPAALGESLREVQEQGLRTMDMITQGLNTAIARIRERAHVSGDAGTHGVEFMLDQVRETLDSIRPPRVAADVRGEGESADGLVRAGALPGARVDTIDISDRAMRMASQDLAEHVVTAVNAALAGVTNKGSGVAAGDPGELAERVRAVQDMSLSQMRAYTQSLRNLMSSIQRR